MAEDHKHIDEMIRARFDNFEPEPPAHVWEKVKSSIGQNPTPPSSGGIILPIIIAVSLLVFLSGLIHHLSTGAKKDYTRAEINTASVLSTGSTSVTDASMQDAFYSTDTEYPAPAAEAQNINNDSDQNIPVRVPFENKYSERDKDKEKAKSKKAAAEKHNVKVGEPQNRSGEWKPGLVQALKSGNLSYAEAQQYKLSARDIRKLSGYTDNYTKRNMHSWTLGVYFNPEATVSKDESISNSIAYNISVLPGISFNRFFIQSGLNIRFASDKGNLAVDYNRFLGTYEDVYEVSFDSTENGIIPTYHTQTVEVFDTVNHYYVTDTKARYTYLEIPVFLGYRYTFGKFSLFGKAGPAASFLLIKDVPSATAPEENARIINVNYQVPVRSAVNWQLVMGAGFEYSLSKNLNISLEPTWRLGLNKEYELQGNKNGKTSAFGVRAGLNYRF